MWCEGTTTKELAVYFQRKPSAITSCTKKLGLVENAADAFRDDRLLASPEAEAIRKEPFDSIEAI
jgi:hypothetical protein